MKKFPLILLILPLIFASFNLKANKKDSVSQIITPVADSSIESWVPVNYELVIKNVGTEVILATDTVYFLFAQFVSPSFIPYKVFVINRTLAPKDTIHFSFT